MAVETEIQVNEAERVALGPVALRIFATYATILTVGYFVGNMIYQIPG